MDQYDYKYAICVGDGYTDVRMAKNCDLVFARDVLADILEESAVPYIPWENFYDVRDYILNSLASK